MFGALLLDLYPLFTKPGVRYVSGFFGPAERVLIDSGARIEFVPADFRRFVTIAEQFAPRVVASAVAMPDADGWMSLSLHAGATVRRDATRGRGSGPAADRRSEPAPAAHVRYRRRAPAPRPCRRGRRARDRRPAAVPARGPGRLPTSSGPSPSTRPRSSATAARCRRASVRSRRRSSRCSPNATAATTASTARCSRPVSCSCTGRARSRNAHKGALRRVLGLHVRPRHAPSSTAGSTATRTSASCRSTS